MKKVCSLPILAAILLSACSSDQTTETHLNNADQGAVAGPLPEPANSPSNSPTPATTSNESAPAPTQNASPNTPSSNSTSTQTTTDYPKGIPVPGKKGMVFSPYAQYAGQVDVNGFPSGSIVVCPFTHKKFVVP